MSKRAEEVALERCPISSDAIKESRNQKKRAIFCNGYEQAEKDLAQDFHADTLIGDKDYEVIHTVAYGCGDEMHTTEISVETEMFKPGQKVKVIIVNDE